MSTNLYVRPYQPEPLGEDLAYELKKSISQKYWDHDGSLSGDWIVLGAEDVPYLEGLRDAKIKDADTLIEKILKFGAVEIALIG